MACLPVPSFWRRPKVAPQSEAPRLFWVVLPHERCTPAGLFLAGRPSMKGMVVVNLGQSELIKNYNLENPSSQLEVGHVILETLAASSGYIDMPVSPSYTQQMHLCSVYIL